jgi:inner membrane protein
MPLPLTHALIPVAGALAPRNRAVPWRLVITAAIASALPDIDSFSPWIWGTPNPSLPLPAWWHRGATHSLFVGIVVGLLASLFRKQLKVGGIVAGVVVGGAMASHGLLDMFTDQGVPVAYLWPVSSERLFADWRPIHSSAIAPPHILAEILPRLWSETIQLILPMFALALLIHVVLFLRAAWKSKS